MIETKRLLIKPLTAEDLKKYLDSPVDLAQELGLIPSETGLDEETKEAIVNSLLPNIVDETKDAHFYTMWLVIAKAEKAIVGGICFHGEPNENGEVEIGYGTDYGYRNQGFMTETIAALMQWIRANKNVKSIIAETDSFNVSSVKVLEKNGFEMIQKNGSLVKMRLCIHP